ncbi:DUF6346 domain-containing protein [Mangrovihabitans endophyticus]|uniref:Uncharacterized protein n=1 Tax=Mangrovihabitans endophyticus TaxID=1751298 RepID=A0A8J3BWU0_9ACTN|nr:DUF6346 domain-containing protein [Mangrovihabitans endophyticus]GGK73746.1 hypothetical protein GCM10012284_04560 [Mangrovihabitans endophyticus]
MSDDAHRRRMQERLDKIGRDNADADGALPARPDPAGAVSPVTPARRPARRRGWLFLAALAIASFVLGELALTVQGWTGPDFADADRTGQATVVDCERHGPIGRGFGYWDECTADIVWNGGFTERHTFDRRNFLHADEVGTTVTIGQGTGFRGGGVTYSRPELPHRPLITALGVILVVLAALPALLLVGTLVIAIRNLVRRR